MITSSEVNDSVSETVFINSQRKSTKKFDFSVVRNNDGSYVVSQSASRIYPSGLEVVKSVKSWRAENIHMLRNSDFMNTRQARFFLRSLTVN
ncbi:hypothetical protein DFO55_1249 [Grimontella sp. AG753]|nr:hypothetical protein DFO55_1249 [Grimontella sp. AG753]